MNRRKTVGTALIGLSGLALSILLRPITTPPDHPPRIQKHILRIDVQDAQRPSRQQEPIRFLVGDPEDRTPLQNVQVSPSVDCQGRVLDEMGLPIAEAWVYASRDGVKTSETTTGAAGQFTLHGLIPEVITLAAVQDGYIDGRVEVNLVTTRFVELILSRRSFVFVTGRITDGSGQPLAEVEVDDISGRATTGPDGTFTLRLFESMMSPGLFSLRAQKKGYADLRFVSEELPQHSLELKMYEAGTLKFEQGNSAETRYHLELVHEFGSVNPGTVRYFKNGVRGTFTPSQNTRSKRYEFDLEGLIPGLYQVTISPAGTSGHQVFAEIIPGMQATMRID